MVNDDVWKTKLGTLYIEFFNRKRNEINACKDNTDNYHNEGISGKFWDEK